MLVSKKERETVISTLLYNQNTTIYPGESSFIPFSRLFKWRKNVINPVRKSITMINLSQPGDFFPDFVYFM